MLRQEEVRGEEFGPETDYSPVPAFYGSGARLHHHLLRDGHDLFVSVFISL